MLDFHASVISLVLFLGKGLEMRGVHSTAARLSLSGQKGCHVFCLFLEERLGDAFWCGTEGLGRILGFMSALFLGTKAGKMRAVHFSLKIWVGFGNPMDLLERFWYGHAFKHGVLAFRCDHLELVYLP
jgi:hypothetical protein